LSKDTLFPCKNCGGKVKWNKEFWNALSNDKIDWKSLDNEAKKEAMILYKEERGLYPTLNPDGSNHICEWQQGGGSTTQTSTTTTSPTQTQTIKEPEHKPQTQTTPSVIAFLENMKKSLQHFQTTITEMLTQIDQLQKVFNP
jgi:hypothetical protein